jgi:hypothetical protein
VARCIKDSFPGVLGAAAGTRSASRRLSLLFRHQVPQRQIIHNVLDILDPVLQAVTTAAQAVVLEVEYLEASVQVLDKLVDE